MGSFENSTLITTATNSKTYEQGLEEAWEIAQRLLSDLDAGGYSNKDMNEIFGEDRAPCSYILRTMSIHEVKAKIDAWEAEKNKPKLGDVVEIGEIGKFLFLGEGLEHYYVLDPSDNDGIPHQFVKKHTIKSIKKTGKHFDIQGMLDKIKEVVF